MPTPTVSQAAHLAARSCLVMRETSRRTQVARKGHSLSPQPPTAILTAAYRTTSPHTPVTRADTVNIVSQRGVLPRSLTREGIP